MPDCCYVECRYAECRSTAYWGFSKLNLLYLYDKADSWSGVLVVVEVCSDQTILGRMVENA